MRTFEDRVIDRQSQLITEQKQTIQHLHDELSVANERLNQHRRAASFYLMIQNAIQENYTLMNAWEEFLTIAKVALDDTPGLTGPELNYEIKKLHNKNFGV